MRYIGEGEENDPDDCDAFVCKIADLLPHAESIIMPDMNETTWRSLMHVIAVCPKIVEVTLLDSIKVVRPTDSSQGATCTVTLFRSLATEFMPSLCRMPYHITTFNSRGCYDFNRDNISNFLSRQGDTITTLKMNMVNLTEPEEHIGGALLMNGCPNLEHLWINNWDALDEDLPWFTISGDIRSSNLMTFCLETCPSLTDRSLSLWLLRYPLLKVLQLVSCQLVTGAVLSVVMKLCPLLERVLLMRVGITADHVIQVVAKSYPQSALERLMIPKSLQPEVSTALGNADEFSQAWIQKIIFVNDDRTFLWWL